VAGKGPERQQAPSSLRRRPCGLQLGSPRGPFCRRPSRSVPGKTRATNRPSPSMPLPHGGGPASAPAPIRLPAARRPGCCSAALSDFRRLPGTGPLSTGLRIVEMNDVARKRKFPNVE